MQRLLALDGDSLPPPARGSAECLDRHDHARGAGGGHRWVGQLAGARAARGTVRPASRPDARPAVPRPCFETQHGLEADRGPIGQRDGSRLELDRSGEDADDLCEDFRRDRDAVLHRDVQSEHRELRVREVVLAALAGDLVRPRAAVFRSRVHQPLRKVCHCGADRDFTEGRRRQLAGFGVLLAAVVFVDAVGAGAAVLRQTVEKSSQSE